VKKKKKKKGGSNQVKLGTKQGPAFQYTWELLWEAIIKTVSERFQYELDPKTLPTLAPIPTLRNLCQKMGIQIATRDYDFTLEEPFTVSLCNILPYLQLSDTI